MSIIQIVERPYLYPQRCFFTGDGNERPILDTGVQDTEGGRVYISLSFMEDLARAAGYTTLAEAQELRDENDRLKRQLAVLPETLEGLVDDVRRASADAELRLVLAAAGGSADDHDHLAEGDDEAPPRSA